jgi:hypothetical protein
MSLIHSKGIENIRFTFTTYQMVRCGFYNMIKPEYGTSDVIGYIDETTHKISDGKKIKLTPVSTSFASRTFYLEDFKTLVAQGKIVIY